MEESITSLSAFSDYFKNTLKLKEVDVKTYSPLALAYIGDGVYELIVRTKVMNHGSTQVHNMHKKSARLVNAGAQAEIIRRLLEDEDLTPEEVAVYKRGRNAKSVTTAKHATVADYRTATGFEALCGYLYLNGSLDRLVTLIGKGLERIGELE
ncbi:Mini-ribonuclease 3 [Lacrimispora saccharolytica]|uniref:Mini-ribonuclease 3 n=1 Tax=Lacrimispora saccharolytica (strain ATCC 35040 / DSM 2544 / NRCC 2533 / WM1) TaxID=610130 RepID=D9R8E8_LACSW|nr:ribonuclease III domain-containing protein [Lacrimispora saccharolytica]ADL03900.1 ribonuclease III [[Clostridium] saccharolyticum WM1]QRV21788.1 ribonuclease III [Lacrimispora saccharolytica]